MWLTAYCCAHQDRTYGTYGTDDGYTCCRATTVVGVQDPRDLHRDSRPPSRPPSAKGCARTQNEFQFGAHAGEVGSPRHRKTHMLSMNLNSTFFAVEVSLRSRTTRVANTAFLKPVAEVRADKQGGPRRLRPAHTASYSTYGAFRTYGTYGTFGSALRRDRSAVGDQCSTGADLGVFGGISRHCVNLVFGRKHGCAWAQRGLWGTAAGQFEPDRNNCSSAPCQRGWSFRGDSPTWRCACFYTSL